MPEDLSFVDFLMATRANVIATDHFAETRLALAAEIRRHGYELDQFIGATLYRTGESTIAAAGQQSASHMPYEQVQVSLAGLLAACHFRDIGAVVALLFVGDNCADDSGIHTLQYLKTFEAYQTPWDHQLEHFAAS